mmetsp:Transcript_37669/g.107044  ORF Transcript_37669/g.107044 Transcript_37669/m.107044 type:complete len:268 (-) Transcript_37669:167-970(-)
MRRRTTARFCSVARRRPFRPHSDTCDWPPRRLGRQTAHPLRPRPPLLSRQRQLRRRCLHRSTSHPGWPRPWTPESRKDAPTWTRPAASPPGWRSRTTRPPGGRRPRRAVSARPRSSARTRSSPLTPASPTPRSAPGAQARTASRRLAPRTPAVAATLAWIFGTALPCRSGRRTVTPRQPTVARHTHGACRTSSGRRFWWGPTRARRAPAAPRLCRSSAPARSRRSCRRCLQRKLLRTHDPLGWSRSRRAWPELRTSTARRSPAFATP